MVSRNVARRASVPDDEEPLASEKTSQISPLRAEEPQKPLEAKKETAPVAPRETMPAPRKSRFHLRRTLLFAGPVLVGLGALALYLTGGRFVSTDDAYVKADILTVASEVSGTVSSLGVHNDQHVAKGDVLFQLDDEPYRIALADATAHAQNIANQIGAFKAFYHSQMAQAEAAKADVAFYQRAMQRQTDLVARQAASQAVFDQAHRDYDAARDKQRAAELQAQSVLAQLGGSADEPVEDNAQYRQIEAQIRKAARDLRNTTIRASVDGIVTNVDHLQPGTVLPAAQPAFSLVGSDHLWVEAFCKETDLTFVKAGDPAELTVDAYPGQVFAARVATISPATGAQFAVLPAQNASGNWVKVVQRLPVRLDILPKDGAPILRAGMSVVVAIDTNHRRTLSGLIADLGRTFGF